MPSRERFYVELKPGETTFVSWKKLVKESQKAASFHSPSALSDVPAGAHPALEARIAPEVAKEKDPLPPPPNRFNSVIERIERLYQGGTSDDEPSDFMDDDKYDTRDSFIDDRELDDYFSVEKAKLKHSGFFVNKGKLEEVEPPPTSAVPKKRKRKDIKLSADMNEEEAKQLKSGVRLKAAARGVPLPPGGVCSPFKVDASIEKKKKSFRGPGWDMGKSIAMAVVEKELNSARTNSMMVYGNNKAEGKGLLEAVAVDRLMVDSVGSVNARDRTVGLIDINEPLERDAIVTFEPREPLSASVFKSKAVQKFSKDDDSKESLVGAKKLSLASKEISPIRNKGTALERAFLDLEKTVAELYPPSLVVREPEQGKRNRLPRDLKQKLAKVARLADKQGRITEEMVERLMGILGHVIRERTLKRHLKAMVEMGVSAMQEKEGRLQGIKKEVTEMIKSRVHNLQAQVIQPPDEFQSLGVSPEKASEGRYQWDHATEDKICDLYEQYIEGMDDNKGPHLRKLYAELAELWPDGWMDNSGIKLAVHRAKERKKKQSKASNSSDAKRRRRPAGKPKMEDSSGDGLTLLQLFTPVGNDNSANEKSSSFLHEGYSSHGYESQPPGLQEKKKVSGKHGSAEGKSKINDEGLLLKKKMKKEMDKVDIITADTMSLPFMSSSMQHASFGSPVAPSLTFESPLQNNVGTPPNGVFLSPN